MLHHPGLSYTVFNIQQNIIRHSKKENVNHNSEKNQSIEINLEVTEMMELLMYKPRVQSGDRKHRVI